ncbi:putative Ig domain-containing protein, partial [Campylobacter jejuni]
AYSQTVTASGGTGSYSFATTAGSLPPGLTLSAGGVISGTPTAGGTYNFTLTSTDSSTGAGPYTGSRAYALTVNAPTLTLTPTSGSVL